MRKEIKRLKGRSAAVLISCCLTFSALIPAEKSFFKAEKVSAAEYIAEFYVSPEGSDTNDGSFSAPFLTLERARDAVREINGSMSGDICVYLRGGTYRVNQTIVFDTRDSGSNGHTVFYKAYEDEVPVFNGAEQVTGWTRHDDRIFKAHLDRDYKLRNLFVNDARASMTSIRVNAKGGFGDYNITKGQADWAWDSGKKSDGISYNISDIPRITSNFDDLEIINGTTWNENIVCTRDIKEINGSLVMFLQQPYGAIAQTPGWNAGFSCSGTHTIYNAFAFMDEPGEFYFDKTEKVLYYYPKPGEDMSTADVEAPVLDQIIVIEGKSTTDRVKNLSFSGITFVNTEFQLTEVAGSHGKTTCQAAQSYTSFADSNWHTKKYEMSDTLPAMIHITNSESISFTDNVIKHSGADGISMVNDVVNSEISGNYINDITSSGITVGHPQHIYIGDGSSDNHEKYAPGVEGICKNNRICDNMLYDISVVHGFGGCAAITAYFVEGVTINSNQINKTAYNGIHLGWGWCNFKDSTTCKNNSICYNRVTNCLNRLHDSGGIYTIGQMPGTIINENYVEGIPAAAPYQPTYGLHNDEGTAYIEENNNVLEISPDVTYTINCEDFGQKHHLKIKNTYATVNKMGKNPPDSDIDTPVVVSDNVWPLAQYKICLASGLKDSLADLIPSYLLSDADRVFPAACATKCGLVLPVRSSGSTENTIWFAPEGTTEFKAGSDMTKASGVSTSIKTPEKEGEYYLYVVGSDGTVKSRSRKLLRVSGSASQIDASSYDVQSGVQLENCSEGGQDVAYIDNGDYIGFKNVDFGKAAESIDFRVASAGSGGKITVKLGAPDGETIGECNVTNTGGWQKYNTTNCKISKTSGMHDVYFVFSGGEGSLFNINWWKLNTVYSELVYGDVNEDEIINIVDVIMLKNASLEGNYSANGDFNSDYANDKADISNMIYYFLGKIADLID